MSIGYPVIQVALDDWLSSARLPKALDDAGITVVALCARHSPLRLSRYLSECHIVAESGVAAALEQLVERLEPHAVIASDECAVRCLERLAVDPGSSVKLARLLRRSLGPPSSFPIITSKWATGRLASDLGIRVPEQALVASLEAARQFAADFRYPIVLKRENSYGGMACRVCRTPSELDIGYSRLRAGRFGRRSLLRRLAPERMAASDPLIIQQHCEGVLAFTGAVARDGAMIAGLAVLAEVTHPQPTGPSTVVRAIEAPKLLDATARLIRATGCSGFVGVDFIMPAGDGEPILLEMNPRVTPVCHLGALLGADLCAAFGAAFCGLPEKAAGHRHFDQVAFFPNEWLRDRHSLHLSAAYHDVPLDEPALLEEAYRRLPMSARILLHLGLSVPPTATRRADGGSAAVPIA